MSESIAVNQVGRKQSVFVELDRSRYTFTHAKKSGYQLISVALPSGQTNASHMEIYSTGVKMRLVNQSNKQNVVRLETCIQIPLGSPGPTFPGPVCPPEWPFPGWPTSAPPGTGDLFLLRVVGRGIKTRAASIANTEQLLQFLSEVSSEVEKRVGTEPLKAIKGIAVFNQKFQRDASFRSQLQDALLEVGVPGTVKISEANLADDIGDVLNAACAASSVAGAAPVAAGACGLALGYAIGKFLGGL